MKAYTRTQIVHALRSAADAIEAGADTHPCILFASETVDGFETDDIVDKAEDRAQEAVQPDGEYDPDVLSTTWGVYVMVERADYEVTTHDTEGCTPRELGYDFDEWWNVWLRAAWPSTPINDNSDDEEE